MTLEHVLQVAILAAGIAVAAVGFYQTVRGR